MEQQLLSDAIKNIGDIVHIALDHQPNKKALVIYDTQNGLTNILTEAYRTVLPDAMFVDFDLISKQEVVSLFDQFAPGDLVVLLQSSNFRLDEFRIRLHLFKLKLKVIEHMHLYRNRREVWNVYINTLAYDPKWYRVIGPKLKDALDAAQVLEVVSGNEKIRWEGGLEKAKLNIGDYTGMENIGGTFPIGEVFTEAMDLKKCNGSFRVYAFAGQDFAVNMHEPFRVDIKEGIVTGWDAQAPKGFVDVVESIKQNERPFLREIGFGLNRAITKEHYLEDITAFERIFGMHFSLGEKHSVYKKEGITTHKSRFHVDVFPVVEQILIDGKTVFENGKYLI